ncbi:hypothetical protein FS837_011574 [Tulasnella sp. UAMH 9824]|nr:hypothetical protein FS837_011574 [Tulasnella sp. UAMH 9824]
MFSVFGCRIALEMPDYPKYDPFRSTLPVPGPSDYEMEEDVNQQRRRKGDLESASGHSLKVSSAGDRFSEVSNLNTIKGSSPPTKPGPEISPLSQAATLVPMPTAEIGGEGSRGVQPSGEFRGSEVTLSSNEASQPQPATTTTTTKTPAESRRSTLVGSTAKPSIEPSSSQIAPILDSRTNMPVEWEARGVTSQPAAKAGPSRLTQDDEDEDFDELDRELAEKYDEEGRIRPPRRTHQRQWRSDDYFGLPYQLSGHGFLMPRASSSLVDRPASAIYYSSGRRNFPPASSPSSPHTRSQQTVFPADPTPSGSTTPSRRRSKDWSISPRGRMSRFFSRHRNSVVAVPEGEVPTSFSPTPSVPDHSTAQTPSRRHSTSSSKSRPGSRMRKLLQAGSPSPTSQPSAPNLPPSSPSSPSPISSARRDSGRLSRRDSDAMTICSASTGFAFDNSGTYEAPDFN